MENTILCPKCGSSDVEKRNHEQQLTKIGGVLLSSAGATAGTVGGAASGASIGAAIGAAAGPLGVIMGGTIGTFVGAVSIGVTGGFLGHRFGCFTRAYIEITLEKQVLGLEHSWSAISMIMLTDRTFNEYWIEWLEKRLARHQDTDNDLELKILRYAADGIWLTAFTEVENLSETMQLKQELIQRSYQH